MVSLGKVKEGENTELLFAPVWVGSGGEKIGELLHSSTGCQTLLGMDPPLQDWACLHVYWVTLLPLVQQEPIKCQAEDIGQHLRLAGTHPVLLVQKTGHTAGKLGLVLGGHGHLPTQVVQLLVLAATSG